jgi:1-phosphatidylinositol phosphodiesterase
MNLNLKKWMNLIDDSANVFSLNLVGTHDCVTKYVQLSHISQCQDKNIYEQLCMGVRALDIRVGSKGDRLVMLHGIAKAFNTKNKLSSQMDMQDVLSQCYKFLDENSSETIIFQFKNDSNKEMEKCFDNLFYTYISKSKNYWYLENRIPTLHEARGKIILVRRCKMNLQNKDFTSQNTGIDFSNWVEQDTISPSPLTLKTNSADNTEFIIQDRYKYKPIPRWSQCIKPFLDERGCFDNKYVICYLSTAGGIKGPKNNAKYINSKFNDYPLKNDNYYGILYMDFPTEDIIIKVINTNIIN